MVVKFCASYLKETQNICFILEYVSYLKIKVSSLYFLKKQPSLSLTQNVFSEPRGVCGNRESFPSAVSNK